MSKKALIGIICAVVVALAGGTAAFVVTHQKKDDGQTKEVVEKEEEVNHDGQVKSYLTGEWVDQSHRRQSCRCRHDQRIPKRLCHSMVSILPVFCMRLRLKARSPE